jgi:hypothetical protein
MQGIYHKKHAEAVANKILAQGYEHYINAPTIGRIGMAFYEAEAKSELLENYFEEAQKNIHDLRNRCLPYASPIDLFRCSMDELWPAGANLESLYGRKMYVGLSRVVEPGVTFLAHHDIFPKDAPDSFQAKSLLAQMACNVYLTMPEEGGALRLWSNEISPQEFDAMRKDSHGIGPSLLGKPQLEILPEPGDLVIFNSRLMHAITPGHGDSRLSLSCFMGYRGTAAPLTIWS